MKRIKNEEEFINYYLKLPYEYIVIPEENGGYSIRIKEFPGCNAFGETIEEAFKNIKETMKIWLSEVMKQNLEIPIPESKKEYSGRFVTRIPKSLHKKLVEKAESEGVSLNQYVLSCLAREDKPLYKNKNVGVVAKKIAIRYATKTSISRKVKKTLKGNKK
ncbi:MAG: toxin-antitoxin system HicB family antitoxin [Caldisericia bacterium]